MHSCMHTLHYLKQIIDKEAAGEVFPLSPTAHVVDMLGELKEVLPDLSEPMAADGTRGVPLKEVLARCFLTTEGEFCLLIGSKRVALSVEETVDLLGPLGPHKLMREAILSRLHQHNQVTNLWDQTHQEVEVVLAGK